MSFDLYHDPETDCIYLTIEGPADIDLMKTILGEVGRLHRETGCHRILNDMTAARIDISLVEIFDIPQMIDDAGLGLEVRRALVFAPDFAEAKFAESVSRNRGHNIRVFHDRQPALDWLLERGGAEDPSPSGRSSEKPR